MKRSPALALLCLLAFSSAGQTRPAPIDKPKLEAYVRHLLLWNPQIAVKISDPKPAPMSGFQEIVVTGSMGNVSLDEHFYLSNDGKKILRGAVYDLGHSPFQRELDLIKTGNQPGLGTPGAPVLIVLFSDYQCGYCKQESRMLRDNLIKTFPKEVRLYFKDFPIDSIHPWARPAAIAGRCVFRQNAAAFWDYHDWIFDKQQEITPENLKGKVNEWAQASKLDMVQFSRCFDTRATEHDVNASIAEARALRITSTPTLFINGRMLSGSLQWPQLKAIIDWELDHHNKTGQGGDKCCELTLPTPLPK